MKIKTNTIIKNLEGKDYTTVKGGKEEKLTLGDVLFGSLNNATGIELKVSWALLPLLASDNKEIELSSEQTDALIRSIEQAARLPGEQRYNLVVYGKVLDILNGVVENPKKK